MNFLSKLSELFTDPVFWIATIFCGLLLGILANYLTRVADRLIARASTRRQANVQAANSSIREAATRLLRHPADRFDVKLDVLFYQAAQIRWGIFALVFFTLGIGARSIPNFFPRPLASIVLLICMSIGIAAWSMLGVSFLRESRALRILDAYEGLKSGGNSTNQEDAK